MTKPAPLPRGDRWLYGNNPMIVDALRQMPDREWTGLLYKLYGITDAFSHVTDNDHPNRVAMFNWYGKDERSVFLTPDPADRDQHERLVHNRAIQAARRGWSGFAIDSEMYGYEVRGSEVKHFPDEPIGFCRTRRIAALWRDTARACRQINPNMRIGGTGVLRSAPNGVYDAVVSGVLQVCPWTEWFQGTFVAGWNGLCLERRRVCDARHRKGVIEWLGGIEVSRQKATWFNNRSRWPLRSPFWVLNAKTLLDKPREYVDALMEVGA